MRNWQDTRRVTVRVGLDSLAEWERAARNEGYWNLPDWISKCCNDRAFVVKGLRTATPAAATKSISSTSSTGCIPQRRRHR